MSNEARAVRQRGWSALLAVLLLVTGAGLGGPSGLAHALRAAPQAGSGAADGRDPAVVRAGTRPAILAQRSGDPSSLPVPVEPALAPSSPAMPAALATITAFDAVRADGHRAPSTRAYEARAPPPASA